MVTAYSLNETVVPTAELEYLTMYPTGALKPATSTLNALGGQVVANAAIVPAGTNGAVTAYVTDQTQLITDINGYFTTNAAAPLVFQAVTPCRVADTRNPTGPLGWSDSECELEAQFPDRQQQLRHPCKRSRLCVECHRGSDGQAELSDGLAGWNCTTDSFDPQLLRRRNCCERGYCAGRRIGCRGRLRLGPDPGDPRHCGVLQCPMMHGRETYKLYCKSQWSAYSSVLTACFNVAALD